MWSQLIVANIYFYNRPPCGLILRKLSPASTRGRSRFELVRIECPDCEFAARHRPPFVAIHGRKLLSHVGKNGGEFLRPLRARPCVVQDAVCKRHQCLARLRVSVEPCVLRDTRRSLTSFERLWENHSLHRRLHRKAVCAAHTARVSHRSALRQFGARLAGFPS
jgi:hypothetical protein